MRCPDCNKFVGLEPGDVECDDLDISDDGTVTCSARIVRVCAECSTELKEATFDLEQTVEVGEGHQNPVADHIEDTEKEAVHQLMIQNEDSEYTESGGGRYAKNLCGVRVWGEVVCKCEPDTVLGKFEMEDEIAASAMDELV